MNDSVSEPICLVDNKDLLMELSKEPLIQLQKNGRYDAQKIAKFLDWKNTDLSEYLDVSKSSISRNPRSESFQKKLGALTELIYQILKLTRCNVDTLRAWLKTPIWAFDNESAKDLILNNDFETVKNLLFELEAGTVA